MNTHRTGSYWARQRLHRLARWAALAVLVSLGACTEKSPVQIGSVGNLSDWVAALGIRGREGTNLVMAALERQSDGEHLKQTLRSMGAFPGVQGTLSFDPFGESDRQAHLSVVGDGRFAPLD